MFGAGLLGLAWVVCNGVRTAGDRRKRIESMAGRWDLSFRPERAEPADLALERFGVFSRKPGGEVFNVCSGSMELAGRRCGVHLGDFRSTAAGGAEGSGTRTDCFSFATVRLPDDLVAPGFVPPVVLAALAATRDTPELELDGRTICLADGRYLWDPDDFQDVLDVAQTLIDVWPSGGANHRVA